MLTNFLTTHVEKMSNCLLLIFFATLITVSQRNFYFIVPVLFSLGGIVLIVYQHITQTFTINRKQKIVLYVFGCYTITSLVLAWIHQDSLSSIKFNFIPLVLLPAFLFFCYVFTRPTILNYIFPTTAIITGIFALYNKYIIGTERVFAQLIVIPAAGIAMTLSLFCLVLFFDRYKKNIAHSLLMLVACLFGMVASFLTGTRGAWVCCPIVLLLLFVHFRSRMPGFIKLVLIPVVLTLLIVCLLFLNTGFSERLMQIKTDLVMYFNDHNPNSSIGLRLEFWKSAIDGYITKPLFGWGNTGYIPMKEIQVENGLVIAQAVPFQHAHNQFLDVLVKQGIFLLIATLAILLVPLCLFFHYRKNNEIISILGYILIFNVCTFCLSDAFLRSPLGMIFYIMTTYILLGFLIKYESA